MEVEHGLNTANIYPLNNGGNLGHFDPNGELQNNFDIFDKAIKSKNKHLRDLAFDFE